jgi:hypothetical protein
MGARNVQARQNQASDSRGPGLARRYCLRATDAALVKSGVAQY